MSGIDDIIALIMHDEKLAGSRSCREKIYSDTPLLRRASDVRPPEVPQKIKDMKAIAYSNEAFLNSSAWLFCEQGNFMADYTDDHEYSESFNNILPTYAGLSTDQLRGYFSWRTSLRNGEFPDAPLPFINLYAYELINRIGVSSTEDGFMRLAELSEHYSSCDRELKRFLPRWLSDYAVYYGLDKEYYDKCPEFQLDKYMLMLMEPEKYTADELFAAIRALSVYDIGMSEMFLTHGDEAAKVSVGVYRAMTEYYEKHRKKSLFENYFGAPVNSPVRMFENSIFNDAGSPLSAEREINEIRRYTCKNGAWMCYGFNKKIRQSSSLGELIKAVDAVIREKYGMSGLNMTKVIPKNTETIIKNVLEKVGKEQKLLEARNVKIDLSKLSSIRADADITRDALLTESDREELEMANAEINEPAELPEENENASILTAAESEFLKMLLTGGDASGAARKHGTMPSLLADSINEKLFDIFADTVIDMAGAAPEMIEDYTDELKEMLEKGEI